jgi:hypothetical protein
VHRASVRLAVVPLCLSLCVAQQAPPSPVAGEAPKIRLVVVEGEGAINNLKRRTAREVIIQVEDENHKPIGGATVSLLLPSSGPGGQFSGGGLSQTLRSDPMGRVRFNFRPNNVAGQFQANVTASYQGVTAATTVAQTNSLVAAAAAGGAAAGGAAAGGGIGVAATVGIVAAAVAAAAVTVVKVTGNNDPETAQVSVGQPSLPSRVGRRR